MTIATSITLFVVVLIVLFIWSLMNNTAGTLRVSGALLGGLFELLKIVVRGLVALVSGMISMIRRR